VRSGPVKAREKYRGYSVEKILGGMGKKYNLVNI
jgi:hypothetical protein